MQYLQLRRDGLKKLIATYDKEIGPSGQVHSYVRMQWELELNQVSERLDMIGECEFRVLMARRRQNATELALAYSELEKVQEYGGSAEPKLQTMYVSRPPPEAIYRSLVMSQLSEDAKTYPAEPSLFETRIRAENMELSEKLKEVDFMKEYILRLQVKQRDIEEIYYAELITLYEQADTIYYQLRYILK